MLVTGNGAQKRTKAKRQEKGDKFLIAMKTENFEIDSFSTEPLCSESLIFNNGVFYLLYLLNFNELSQANK